MADPPSKEELLRSVPLFHDLTKKHLTRVAALMTPLHEPPGTVLASEGSPGAEFFIIIEGNVEVRRGDTLITTCGPGDYVGEIALLTNRPRSATLITKTSTTLEVLSRGEFSSLLHDEPEIATQIMGTMADRLADLEDGA